MMATGCMWCNDLRINLAFSFTSVMGITRMSGGLFRRTGWACTLGVLESADLIPRGMPLLVCMVAAQAAMRALTSELITPVVMLVVAVTVAV